MLSGAQTCSDVSGDANRAYCDFLFLRCEQPPVGGKIVLDTQDGQTHKFDNADGCKGFAKFRAQIGVPAGFTALTSGGSPTGPGMTAPRSTDTSDPAFAQCKGLGQKCIDYMGVCAAKKQGPYYLPPAGSTPIMDQDHCKSLAVFYAGLETPKETAATPGSMTAIQPDGAIWKADDRIRFARCFAKVGFSPSTKNKIHVESLTLLFAYGGGMKGIKIKIAYKVDHISGGTYRLRYHIYQDGDSVPKEPSDGILDSQIDFAVADRQITDTLAFGVTLYDVGKFNSIESIRIVKI